LKKAILSSILLLSSASLFADTTMCFKENHKSMATIESTPLDGGICAGKFSVNDMKAKGWNVDDIKISQSATGMNFIYILKTPNSSTPSTTPNFVGNQAQMEANIMAKLEKKKVEEEKAKVEKELKDAAIDAEKLYTTKCQNCHGATGEKRAYNSARPLKDLSYEDMQESIKDYKNGSKNSGNATIMTPYANFIDYKELKGIHAYISKINNK
jgi:cytochrome c553